VTSTPTTITAVRNDAATALCGLCGTSFTPTGRQRWCSDACRQAAWRRRRQAPRPTLPAKTDTIYQCPDCQARYLGEQRCADCNTWCQRLGPGGSCPHCDDLVAVTDLITSDQFRPNPSARR